MQKRIVFLRSNHIAPDPRVEKETRALVAGGYMVNAVGWDKTGEFPPDMIINGIHYYRLRVLAKFGRGLRNLIHELRWQVALFVWLARHQIEYDCFHACDFDTVLPALVCKVLWRKAVVYDIFDFYADMLRATPAPIKKIIRALDLRIIGWVDAIILADAVRLEQISGSKPKRYVVIYNSPEDTRVESGGTRPEKSCLHIAYVGNVQIERGLLPLLEVLRCHPEWSLALAGFGGDVNQIRSMASELPNVAWYGLVPYRQALQLNADADVLIATYDPVIPNHRYSSPNKVFEAMMLGKPIIVARGTHMDQIIESVDCGLAVEYGKPADLEAALGQLQNDLELRQRLGVNARRAYDTQYSWICMQERLLKLYQEI